MDAEGDSAHAKMKIGLSQFTYEPQYVHLKCKMQNHTGSFSFLIFGLLLLVHVPFTYVLQASAVPVKHDCNTATGIGTKIDFASPAVDTTKTHLDTRL